MLRPVADNDHLYASLSACPGKSAQWRSNLHARDKRQNVASLVMG